MLTFRLLGGIELTDAEGRELDALLRQPKHAALLAYLSLPRPGTWHRRDSILAAFWPETDQSRARASLRSALYTLRGHLPDESIRSRGDDELSVAPELIITDVSQMFEHFDAARYADALSRYQGELLPGLFLTDAPEFEKWLEPLRSRVSATARKAASHLSIKLEQQGDLAGAIDVARRGYEIDPDDEAAVRRWILLLDKAGDRSQAFAVYERFRNHMSEAFGVRPSAETVALLDAVRTRRESSNVVGTQHAPSRITAGGASKVAPRPRRIWALALVPVTLAVIALLTIPSSRQSITARDTARSLVVLPMENETGDPALDYVAVGIAEGIARRLDGLGGMRIRSAARSDWTDAVRHNVQLIGRELGSPTLIHTSLRKFHDSLEVAVAVVNASTSSVQDVASRRFTTGTIRDVESRLAADVAGTVLRKSLPEVPRALDQPVDPDSYRLMLKGWHTMLANPTLSTFTGPPREYAARDQFSQATAIDPLNARAWSGLSSVWASLTVSGQVPFAEGVDRTSAAALHAIAIDSLQGSAWANLAITRALRYDNLTVGLDLIRKAEHAEPSNPEIFLIKGTLLRAAHRYDEARDAIRIARTLDKLSLVYLNHEAAVEFCADRPDAALRIFEDERKMNPDDVVAVTGMIRALALLGRFDEAIALWRRQAESSRDSALVTALAAADGENAYWDLRHRAGVKRLESLKQKGSGGRLELVLAQFGAGDPDAAYRTINATPALEKPALYRLTCMPAVDEYRHTSRFTEAIARIGFLKPR